MSNEKTEYALFVELLKNMVVSAIIISGLLLWLNAMCSGR